MNQNISSRIKRARRIRNKVQGSSDRPRLSVFRSNKAVTVQLIDDVSGKTILTVTQKNIDGKVTGAKTDIAKAVGTLVAKKAQEKKITSVIFDKGSYAYHGRVKAVAEGAREGGLKF